MHEVDKEAELPAEPPVWSSEVIRGNQRQSELPAEPPVWSTRCHLPRGLELPAESSVWSTRPRSPKTAIGVIATDDHWCPLIASLIMVDSATITEDCDRGDCH